jgi:two-component sensor histidine kinase
MKGRICLHGQQRKKSIEDNTTVFRSLRKTGIEFIKDIPWGTHICGFYQSKKDLLSMLIPYFKAGLEDNEYCLWITCEPIDCFEAMMALKDAMPNFKRYIKKSQIEILSHEDWYLKYGDFDGDKTLGNWTNKLNEAMFKGFDGIRISGNTEWLKKRYWKTFIEYEGILNKVIGQLKMIVLCTYNIESCQLIEIVDLVSNHQFSFIHSKDSTSINDNIIKFERFNLIDKMASAVVHEIRNPMTSIKGFLQLLQEKKTYEKDRAYFNLMIEEIERVNSIISEFLSLDKKANSKFKKQNLNDILGAIFPLIQADAIKQNKQAALEMCDVDCLLIDRQEICQLILNIVRNGLEAMPSGGVLSIKTYPGQDEVVLEIKDQGSGISQDILKRLGTPFLTTKENGTGLGLAVCYRIAERNNATIAVDTSHSGTTFYVKFKNKSIKTGAVQVQ